MYGKVSFITCLKLDVTEALGDGEWGLLVYVAVRASGEGLSPRLDSEAHERGTLALVHIWPEPRSNTRQMVGIVRI